MRGGSSIGIDEDFRRPVGPAATDSSDIRNLLDQLLTELLAFAGLAQESMTRGQGWRFLELGRRIERAWQTAVLLRGTLTTPLAEEQAMLEAVLQTADSIMTYRTRYLATMQTAPVLDLLLMDETNPRSVGYQLHVIESHLEALAAQQAVGRHESRAAVGTHAAQLRAAGSRRGPGEGRGERTPTGTGTIAQTA